jgi:hypothetical protein
MYERKGGERKKRKKKEKKIVTEGRKNKQN